jgi:hypothetical protein
MLDQNECQTAVTRHISEKEVIAPGLTESESRILGVWDP